MESALTLPASPAKKAGVNFRDGNPYAEWRQRGHVAGSLHDDGSPPPEKLLQAVWRHQRLRRDDLKTADGRAVRVLHPGFLSVEGGPDFRGAVLRIGNGPAVSGDVEIDLQSAGWRAHGHDRNPNFKDVILHVVWETPKQNADVPAVLALKPFLDAPVAELALALENDSGLPENQRGKCCAPLRELDEERLLELLNSAARVRFENKAAALLARARNSGWEQALWEQLFRALGYKNNVWPMQNLAETKPKWSRDTDSVFALQTRLLGVSGLLPEELTRAQKSSDTFLRRAWDVWWRDRDGLEDCILPREVWKFHGLRPANHPQRRLALASHWLAAGDFIPKLEQWCAKELPEKKLVASLHKIFQVEQDEFWSWHWTFKSERMTRAQPLLGEARVTDLAVNVVLPWLWVRAREGGNTEFQREVERRFLAWPAAEDNSVLKLARQRLLGTSNARMLRTAASQQGLMQIVRDFCEHSNAICTDCRFPELVKNY
jgi:Protein of unknown function (DUF2851)